jgi:hypothetical protein
MNRKLLENKHLPECSKRCLELGVSCPVGDCRDWIDCEEDVNCTSVAVAKHGNMTLREVAERLHVSFVRIKQIEDKTLEKLQRGLSRELGVKREELPKFILDCFNK